MPCAVPAPDLYGPRLSLHVDVDTDIADIVDQLGEAIGDLRVDSFFIEYDTPRRAGLRAGQSIERRGEVCPFGPQAGRIGEVIGLPERRGFELEDLPGTHLAAGQRGRPILRGIGHG